MRGQHFESTMPHARCRRCLVPNSHSQPAWEVQGTHHGGEVLCWHVVSANLLRGGLLGSRDGLRVGRGHGSERDAGSTCGKKPGATTLINIEWRIFTAAAYASSHRQGTRHGGSFPRTCAGPSATTPISIKTPRQIRDFRPADPCGGRRRDRRVHWDRNPEIFRVILAPTMLRTVLAGAIVATAAAFAPAGPVRLRFAPRARAQPMARARRARSAAIPTLISL